MRVSIAVPIYNEESVVQELLDRTLGVLDAIPGGPHEIVAVDDGSSDGTFALLEQACARDPRLVVIRLSRNFGHQAALRAALDHVTGDVVIAMDGDLQDPPESIPRLIEEYQGGHDVVYAIRQERKEGAFLKACYHLFYRTISLVANVQLPIGAGDFGLMSRRVVDCIRGMQERQPYLRGLRAWVGFSQKGVPVERGRRRAGESKYSWGKLLRLAFDGIFSFSLVPIRLAILIGSLAILGSLGYTGYAIAVKLANDQTPKGFTALIVAITFLAGVQLLFLGIIGEYVGRIYEEVKRRPLYIVRRIVGGPGDG
jgi:glycosyltransferase involved in cell wall biosynthesis